MADKSTSSPHPQKNWWDLSYHYQPPRKEATTDRHRTTNQMLPSAQRAAASPFSPLAALGRLSARWDGERFVRSPVVRTKTASPNRCMPPQTSLAPLDGIVYRPKGPFCRPRFQCLLSGWSQCRRLPLSPTSPMSAYFLDGYHAIQRRTRRAYPSNTLTTFVTLYPQRSNHSAGSSSSRMIRYPSVAGRIIVGKPTERIESRASPRVVQSSCTYKRGKKHRE